MAFKYLAPFGSFEIDDREKANLAQDLGIALLRKLLGEPKGWKLDLGWMDEESDTSKVSTRPTVVLGQIDDDTEVPFHSNDDHEAYAEHANSLIAELNECVDWVAIVELALEYERYKEGDFYIQQAEIDE